MCPFNECPQKVGQRVVKEVCTQEDVVKYLTLCGKLAMTTQDHALIL